MKKSSVLLAVSVLLLASAVGLVGYGAAHIPKPTFIGTLNDLLPPAPAGWTRKEKPIAETPEMKQAVGELLNFSDGVFVDYLGPAGERLSVYMAYWVPGKMSHRLIAVHTPDVCWVGGGWKKNESTVLPEFNVGATEVPKGENRVFTAQGTPEYVWFWHLVGNESKSYGTGTVPPWHSSLLDMIQKGMNQREEQFFIRISSSRPISEFISGPVLPDLLKKLPWAHPAN